MTLRDLHPGWHEVTSSSALAFPANCWVQLNASPGHAWGDKRELPGWMSGGEKPKLTVMQPYSVLSNQLPLDVVRQGGTPRDQLSLQPLKA